MKFPVKFFAATRRMNQYSKHLAAPYIRKTFCTEEFTKAEILVTGLGFYDLYLNGEKITKGILAPYISNTDDIVYFDSYDVTSLLKKGKNAVGLMLGNGMQNCIGGRGWKFDKALFRSAPKFAMSITYTHADGTTTTVEADESFKCHPSPLTFDDLRSGNFYNACDEIDGWCTADFDDSDWCNVIEADKPRGDKRICSAEPIKVMAENKPVSITTAYLSKLYSKGDPEDAQNQFKFDFKDLPATLYDFGTDTAGIVRLKIKGKKGQEIFIQFCEFINSEGLASNRNICFCPDGYSQVIHFTCSGKEDVFESQFTYIGAKYAVVYGLTDEQKTEDLLTFLVCNSAIGDRAKFSCSDETMNRLMAMTRVADLANFYYFPTDCPHREKNGWTGDAACSAEHMMLFYTPEVSFTEWLRNICKAQSDCGSLPGVVPTGDWGYEWGNGPAWDNALTELCWQIYRLQGDLQPAKECSETMLRYLSYISQRRDENGLIAVGLCDWLHPDRETDRPKAPLIITDSVISLYIANKSAMLFNALGLKLHEEFAIKLASELRTAIRKNLIDFSTMTVHSRCQTAQAICLYYGVFDECERKAAGEVLLKLVEEQNGHLDCGMIGLRVIFRVLSDLGYADLAYNMITREDHPSYGSFVRKGLTALPERFLADCEYDKPSSLDHHFFGDITAWCLEYVAGIRPISPDTVDIRPCFIEKLDSADGEYNSPIGKISTAWTRANGVITLTVTVPENIKGRIILPNGYVFYVPEDTFDGLHNTSFTRLKSGEYRIKKI